MKLFKKLAIFVLTVFICLSFLIGCGEQAPTILSIVKTGSDGLVDTYTITCSDGETYQFTVTNGKDGVNGQDGAHGVNGQDGNDLSIGDIFSEYKAQGGVLSFGDFLKEFLSVPLDDNSLIINGCLRSVATVYSEFIVTKTQGYQPTVTYYNDTTLSAGAAIIYKTTNEFVYFLTNFHVIFNEKDVTDEKIARRISVYLYGSENRPSTLPEKGADGYTQYDYGTMAIPCEYVGGEAQYDVALMRAKAEDVFAINDKACAVKLANDCFVGETAIAIGNPGGEGLSVTEGIISMLDEQIMLDVDGTTRWHRSIRIDTALYAGNSGGGLFNNNGELIGICNAGDTDDQNINYAIPHSIVTGAADNILYHYLDGNADTEGVLKPTFGMTVSYPESRYEYDDETGYGKIVEKIVVTEIAENSIAFNMGLKIDDLFASITINETTYETHNNFVIADTILTLRPGDTISFTVKRINQNSLLSETVTTSSYTLKAEDFAMVG